MFKHRVAKTRHPLYLLGREVALMMLKQLHLGGASEPNTFSPLWTCFTDQKETITGIDLAINVTCVFIEEGKSLSFNTRNLIRAMEF